MKLQNDLGNSRSCCGIYNPLSHLLNRGLDSVNHRIIKGDIGLIKVKFKFSYVYFTTIVVWLILSPIYFDNMEGLTSLPCVPFRGIQTLRVTLITG